MKNNTNIKQILTDNLKVNFEYPYFSKPTGKFDIDYIAFDEDTLYQQLNSKSSVLKHLIQQIATPTIHKYYDDITCTNELFHEEKSNFEDNDGFTILFDNTSQWAIIHDAGNDKMLLIGTNLVKLAISTISNSNDKIVDWFEK
jgi:hypothetical protein